MCPKWWRFSFSFAELIFKFHLKLELIDIKLENSTSSELEIIPKVGTNLEKISTF
jgi:hypothetical protein